MKILGVKQIHAQYCASSFVQDVPLAYLAHDLSIQRVHI